MNIEFAKSMSGHDRNQYYLIIKKEDEFVYLVNGTTKPLTKPKKKNRKHIQIIKHISDEITGLFDGDPTDITIRKAIKMSKINIRNSFISKNKIIDDRIEIHIPITSKILFSFTTKHVDDVRLYNRIEITKKLR